MARKLLVASFLSCLVSALASPLIDVRITGGKDALPNQFPYQAAIYVYPPSIYVPLEDEFCSGSLISPNYILTCARCLVRTKNATIILGGPHLDILEPQQLKLEVTSSNFIIPDNYLGDKFDWDLALIKLDTPVELMDNIQTIKLAEEEEDYAGVVATVAGWGATNVFQVTVEPVLKWIESSIISYDQCIEKDSWYQQAFAEDNHICQSTEYLYRGAYRGDKGAPLTLDGVQIGLVSYTPDNCYRGYPVVHTKVSKYIGWIKQHSDI